MKTRQTRSSSRAELDEEGDQSLIGFRRTRPSLGRANSSNASSPSGGENKKKSPSSNTSSRLSSYPVDNVESNGKLGASTIGVAQRRSTRTSVNTASGSPSDAEHAHAAATLASDTSAHAITENLQSNKMVGKPRVNSKSKALKNDREGTYSRGKKALDSSFAFHDVGDNTKTSRRNNHEEDDEINEDDFSQHPPPPVKEVTTKNNATTDNRSINEISSNKRRDGPKYLDDNTMKLIYDHLEGYKGEVLDEDDVVAFMSRMQKTANEQAKYQMQLVSGPTARHHYDSDCDSDYNTDDTSVFNDCLMEEEEHAIGHDMFRKIVANIQVEHARKSGNGSRTGSLTNANKLLDKKTLGWIKRAAGIHRNDPGKTLLQKSADGKGGRMSTRRYTRKQALDRRGQQKKERGLDIIEAALTQLEPHYGPFPVRKIKYKKKKKKTRRPDENETTADRKRRKEKEHAFEEARSKKMKPSNEEEELITSKGNPAKRHREAKGEKSKSRKKKKKDETRREKKKNRKLEVEKPMQSAPEKATPIMTSLAQLDWLWRSRLQRCHEVIPSLETVKDYYDRIDIPLHPQLVDAGIVHQLPRMHTLVREHEFPEDIPGRVYDPPRQRHTDQQYAQFCVRLMSCLQGPTRLFATCEFFYSDIDRPWYRRCPFAAAATNMGVPRGATLTRREWSAVRRRMIDKPRRFSEKFIVAQLSDRNKYRSTVRKLQNNPHLAALEKFSFEVYAPIRPGTMVTAFSKRFRIIQRGRVLTFDRMTSLYLIEFENGQFGYELCPDSDIATCGVPTILIPAPPNTDNEDLFLGSSTGPLPGDGIVPKGNLGVNDFLVKTLGFTPVGSQERAVQHNGSEEEENGAPKTNSNEELEEERHSLLETVAEYDSFLNLIEVVDEARKRKEELIGLFADANALMVNSLPFGDGGITTQLSSQAKEHLAWLRSNLEQTNRVLATATEYLRTLFGEAYLTHKSKECDGRESSAKLLRAAVTAQSTQTSQISREWAARLIANSDDVTGTLVWENAADASGKKQRNPPNEVICIDDLWIDIKHRIAAAGQCVCTASYVKSTAASGDPAGPDSAAALDVAHENLVRSFEFPQSTTNIDHLYEEVLEARESAKEDLLDALSLLKTELALSTLKKAAPPATAAIK